MKDSKRQFLREVLIGNSIHSALQHSGVYRSAANAQARAAFRRTMRISLRRLVSGYTKNVSDRQHITNIRRFVDAASRQHASTLKRRLRFGIAQKAVNVYLKLLWCAGEIPMPPHCPLDRIIIGRLPRAVRTAWTVMDEGDYVLLIGAARTVAGATPLAEWELREFGARPIYAPDSDGGD